MGTFTVRIEIGNLSGASFEAFEALVDTGATTTVIPGSILRRLGIAPTRRETFEYASGQQVELDMAEAKARVEGRETTTWVIFGEEGTGALLGAYTLEGVLLGVDPYRQKLIPVRGLVKKCSERVLARASTDTEAIEPLVQTPSFASRWRGRFHASRRGDPRYNALAQKYLH